MLSIVSVYKIHQHNQYAYSGHVINFPQDIATVAQTLPHSVEVLSRYIILRRGCADGYADFLVDKNKVLQCLQWLIANNPYYRNIRIDYGNLEELPEQNASIFQQILNSQQQRRSQQTDQPQDQPDEIEDELEGIVTQSAAPSSILRDNERQVNRILGILNENENDLDDLALGINVDTSRPQDNQHIQWPNIDNRPINEFQEQGYIVRAFPKLFPR